MQSGIDIWENSLVVSYKVNISLPYIPASCILLLNIYPKEVKIYVYTKPVQMFRVVLFAITTTALQLVNR